MKRAALYARVSTLDQTTANQLCDLRQMAEQRGYQIVEEYVDHGISGTRARRPALDRMLADVRHGRVEVVVVWAVDRLARSVKHFIDVLTELDHLGVAFVSYREQIDTAGPLGRAIMMIVATVAELERSLIVERVRAGLRRARLEGRHIGRRPLDIDRTAVVRDRDHGHSLTEVAKMHGISRAMVSKIVRQHRGPASHETLLQAPSQLHENRPSEKTA